jgi:tetratricopeptide (TPR) repeat protein
MAMTPASGYAPTMRHREAMRGGPVRVPRTGGRRVLAAALWVTKWTALIGFVSCGNLTCSREKKESVERLNAGVGFAKARNFPAAAKELEAAVTLDPQNHEAAFALGQVYADDKKWDKAIDAFSAAAKYNPEDAMYRYRLGQAYFEADKIDPAQRELDAALKLNPRLFRAHWYLGRILKKREKYKEAAVAFSEAARLNPRFGKPFVDLGKLYFQWDYLQEAVSVLGQGAQNARDAEDLTNIYYYLGMAYDGLKQYKQAAEAYVKAIDARKENVEARLMAGMAFANAGDKENAKKYLTEFKKVGGGNNQFNIAAATDRLSKLASE